MLSKILYRKQEAANLISCSVRTLDYLIARNEITPRRVGKMVLIPAEEILRFASAEAKQ